MARNALLIVEEYLSTPPNPQAQKNAVTALAAIAEGGDAQAVSLLVKTSLAEKDPELRARAAQGLKELKGKFGAVVKPDQLG